MASYCFIQIFTFTFSPTYSSHTEMQLNNATTFAFSRARLKRTSFRIGSSLCTSKYATTQDSLSSWHVGLPFTDSMVRFPFPSDKAHCSRTLSGYWVGPDSEDGWGFVQAFVDEII